jgi:hypothetical protein
MAFSSGRKTSLDAVILDAILCHSVARPMAEITS